MKTLFSLKMELEKPVSLISVTVVFYILVHIIYMLYYLRVEICYESIYVNQITRQWLITWS